MIFIYCLLAVIAISGVLAPFCKEANDEINKDENDKINKGD